MDSLLTLFSYDTIELDQDLCRAKSLNPLIYQNEIIIFVLFVMSIKNVV